jgi:small subunit ribosomal protein S7
MWDGKKSTAFKVFYDAIDIIEAKKQDAETITFERCFSKRYASRRST